MKKLALGSLVATTLAGTAFAAFSIGDNATVIFNADASVRYDNNIQQQQAGPGKIKDTIYELDPGVTITNAKAAPLQARLTYTEAITRYTDNTNLDTNLGMLNFTSTYTDPKNSANFNAGFEQLNQNTPISGLPGLLRRDSTTVDGGDIYKINEKSKFGLDLSYDRTKYAVAGLANSQVYTVPATYYYVLSPKLDATLGLRYRKTDLSGGNPSYTDYYYNLGLSGEFNPKLNGSITVGVNEHRGASTAFAGGNATSIGLDSKLTWQESAVNTFNFTLSNDFGAAASGQEQQTLALSAGVQSQLSEQLIGFGSVGYNIINYSGPRKDNYFTGSVGVRYNLSRTWSITAAYNYLDNGSNAAGNSFSDNTLTLKVSLTY